MNGDLPEVQPGVSSDLPFGYYWIKDRPEANWNIGYYCGRQWVWMNVETLGKEYVSISFTRPPMIDGPLADPSKLARWRRLADVQEQHQDPLDHGPVAAGDEMGVAKNQPAGPIGRIADVKAEASASVPTDAEGQARDRTVHGPGVAGDEPAGRSTKATASGTGAVVTDGAAELAGPARDQPDDQLAEKPVGQGGIPSASDR